MPLFFTHNRIQSAEHTPGVCPRRRAFKRTSRARPGKIHRSTHTDTESERDPHARVRNFASNNAPRKMRGHARLRACSSEVLTFKYRSELHILLSSNIPFSFESAASSYFLTPSPTPPPTRTRPDRIDADTPRRRLAFYEKHSRGRRGVEKTRSRARPARRGLCRPEALADLLFLLVLFPSRFLSKRRRVLFPYPLWFYQAPVSLFAWICTQILRGL